MPKATSKSSSELEEEGFSPVTNPEEARDHISDLEALMANMKVKIESGDTKNLLKETLENMRTRLVSTFPSLKTADINIIIDAIKDKEFTVLLPRTEETEALLDELLPENDIPSATDVTQAVREIDTLSKEDQEVIAEVFDTLEVVHNQLATVSGLIGVLARKLKPKQLMIVLKSSIRPLIQLRPIAGVDLEASTSKATELPEKQTRNIEMLITPDPNTSAFKRRK